MNKLNLLSKAEMKNVMGGVEPVFEEGQCQKAGDGCTGMAPGGATKVGICVKDDAAGGILICEVK